MKRPRASEAHPSRVVRLNVGGKVLHTSRDALAASGFFASLLDFEGLDTDADGNIFVDRNGKLFSVLLESLRTSRRPHPRTITLWKHQLLDECNFFAMDEVAARIRGHTVDADLSPYCRIIAHEERTGSGGSLVNLFEASLKRKDVADLQLPPLLLSATRSRASQDQMFAGGFAHCKEALNVQMGGILLALEQDPTVAGCVVAAGGAVVSALTGCSAGAPTLPFFVSVVVEVLAAAVAAAVALCLMLPVPLRFPHPTPRLFFCSRRRGSLPRCSSSKRRASGPEQDL